MTSRILILDFGSQYTQLIARQVRELNVFSELLPWDTPRSQALQPETQGIILSGGPSSIYAPGAPQLPDFVLESGLPVLGICYGMQALAEALGGAVSASDRQEYGLAEIETLLQNPLLAETVGPVWMSHGDRVEVLPPGWVKLASSANTPIAAMADASMHRFGLQFHPEVRHTRSGKQILQHFVIDICGCIPDWTPRSIVSRAITEIQGLVGDAHVLSALSGGVDSAVATSLVSRALPGQVHAVFIDTGLLRQGEARQVESAFRPLLGNHFVIRDAAPRFFEALRGVTDPESKRKIIGETFIREFEDAARALGQIDFLAQGTIYPDVVESSGSGAAKAQRIKAHHNVGGLPPDMQLRLVEPLRLLFKDEVRAVGTELGLPQELIWRQPFPGPGLAVRCLGEVTPQRVEILRAADQIFTEELRLADLLQTHEDEASKLSGTSQAFAVLLPVHSVGVMGDQRTYAETLALRAVTTTDFMTADWARLPQELLARVSNRIVNEVPGINRVVYDITSKPPATIEWE